MKYTVSLVSSLTWAFVFVPLLHSSNASISRSSLYTDPLESTQLSLEPINGTRNFHMRGKKAKDDKRTWEADKWTNSLRYPYCVRQANYKCEELKLTNQCFGQNIPYTSTTLDLIAYHSQDESLEKLISYQALKHVPKCWSVIQPFLCAVFLPKCENINGNDMVYLPSLEMCKVTLEPCRILYNTSYFPDFLKCNETNFPSKCNNDVMEMKFNLTGQCLSPLVPAENPSSYYKDIDGCGLECKDPLYTEDEHRLVRKFVAWMASICLVLHFFAISTYAIEWRSGNKFPALIIFYINVLFAISCIGVLLQFCFDFRQKIVCREDNTLLTAQPNGDDGTICQLVFILVYYPMMSAIIWFVIFTYAWRKVLNFKAIGKNQERIDKKVPTFYVIAFFVPALLTVGIFASSDIDANSIVGICFAGYINHGIRTAFVMGPVVCGAIISGFFIMRGMMVYVELRQAQDLIPEKSYKKIWNSICRMSFVLICLIIITIAYISCHIYEYLNTDGWTESLRNSIICKITSTYSYSDKDSSSCKQLNRPSVVLLQIQLLTFFCSSLLMSYLVFTSSALKTWRRFFQKICGDKDKVHKVAKHKIIKQAFRKREKFNNGGRLSISFHNSHTDPVGLKFEMNSVEASEDFSTDWAKNLPHLVNRRCALTEIVSSSSIGHSVDSEISYSVRQVSVESRRNSNDSQVSVKVLTEMKACRRVASRNRGSKSKGRSSRSQRKEFTSRRYSRRDSSTSRESQDFSNVLFQQSHQVSLETAEMGLVSAQRRSGIVPNPMDVFMNQIKSRLDHEDNSDDDSIKLSARGSNDDDNNSDLTSKENVASAGRASKNSNRSINSKKSLKVFHNSGLKKTKKTPRSITKTTNSHVGSGRIKLDKKDKEKKSKDRLREDLANMELLQMNGNLQGSHSGRSDVGIQTEMLSPMEFGKRLNEDDDDDDPMESHTLLSKRISLSASKRRNTIDRSLTESQILAHLLLPSK